MIVAIDPGNEESGMVFMAPDYTILVAHKLPNSTVMEYLNGNVYQQNDYPCKVSRGDTLVIESIQSYGMAVGRTTFETCFWIGRFWQKGLDRGMDVHLYPRPKIFRAVTGENKSSDAVMRQALINRFGGDKKGEPLNILKGGGSDKRSAFAVAVYHQDGARLGEW